MLRSRTVLLLLVSISASAFSLELKSHQKPQTLKFRIAAVTEHVARSSFSPNREAYLAYLTSDNKSYSTVKILFRYLGHEDGLSNDFADFGLVHTFKALRDCSCDESWQSFSTKLIVGKDGNLLPVVVTRYVSPDAMQEMQADQVLPCYVITPQGYKSSKAVKVLQTNSQITEGK